MAETTALANAGTLDPKIFRLQFDLEVMVPQKVMEIFRVAQTRVSGIRGAIEPTPDGQHFVGFLEGNQEMLEKIRVIIERSGALFSAIKNAVFSELEEIAKFTAETFNMVNCPGPTPEPTIPLALTKE